MSCDNRYHKKVKCTKHFIMNYDINQFVSEDIIIDSFMTKCHYPKVDELLLDKKLNG